MIGSEPDLMTPVGKSFVSQLPSVASWILTDGLYTVAEEVKWNTNGMN